MQILHIIGNGFDLNLDLKTSYKSFYNYYKSITSENENVIKLKNNISKNLKNWADLELELGKYTEQLDSIEEFDDITLDIGKNLANYLSLEEEKINKGEINLNKFFEDLSFPERMFLPADKEKLLAFKKKWVRHQWNVNIFTFNYTTVIEKLLGDNQKNVLLGTHSNNVGIKLTEVRHIHGFLDNDMVIGVNDMSQIKNISFHENQDILESIVKTECNRANRNNIDRLFTNRINAAHLICVFGSSLGDTDRKWWELIGEKLKTDTRLIIFTKGDEILPRTRHLSARKERAIKELFLKKTNLSEEEKELAKEKIYVGLNTTIFDGIVNYN
ncbi:AbiH family protein [Maribacter sp. R77961]|uniref:AbiH family protein n=1 Tax=Maribacter sp. R77961 TaxID=3093871 RepID=UPI0037C504C8